MMATSWTRRLLKRFLTPFVCLCLMNNSIKVSQELVRWSRGQEFVVRISPSGRTSFAVVERSMSDRLLARTYRLC
jgi:hypothetical protein